MARIIVFPLFGVFVTDEYALVSPKKKRKNRLTSRFYQQSCGLQECSLGEEYEKYLGQSRKESWVCVGPKRVLNTQSVILDPRN